jgi:DNA polymerase III subunit epsilon
MDLPWQQNTFIAFDLETTGKYPLDAEICEIAAVKWRDGEIVDTFQTLVKPSKPMGDFVISIHNITNEMVATAPKLSEVLGRFHAFIQDGYLIAHHAPFDLGFLAHEFEKAGLALPTRPVFCSCLLGRHIVPDCENHRLATLVKYFNLEGGQAHRALDDAKACLHVALNCFAKVGAEARLTELFKMQGGDIAWTQFSVQALRSHAVYQKIIEALDQKADLQIIYSGGSRPGVARTVKPLGLVRSLDDDFLVATDGSEEPKRYFLKKITGSAL